MKIKTIPFSLPDLKQDEVAHCLFDKSKLDNDVSIGQLYASKSDTDQIIKQINLYDELAEAIARNLVAWDTSRDKKESLLPEVYLKNKGLYKEITGEEYDFRNACERFHVGTEWS